MATTRANFKVEKDLNVDTQESSVQTKVPAFPELPQMAFSQQGSIAFDKTTRTFAYFDGLVWVHLPGTIDSGFSAFKSGNQGIPNAAFTTVGGWSTATPGFNQTTGFNATTGIFTSPVAGNYDVKICIIWQPSNQGDTRIAQFQVNNTTVSAQVGDPNLITRFNLGHSLMMYITTSVHMEAGDTARIQVWQNSLVVSNVLAVDAVAQGRTGWSMTLATPTTS